MNTIFLGIKRYSGVVLSAFIALCILAFGFVGCKKDPIDPPVNPPVEPLTVTSITINGTLFIDEVAITLPEGSAANFHYESNADKTLFVVGIDTTTNKGGSGYFHSIPLSSTVFSVFFVKEGSLSIVKRANVTVTPATQKPTGIIGAKPSTVRKSGESTVIYWLSQNATSAVLKINGEDTSVNPNDSMTVVLSSTTTYEITFTNQFGSFTPTILTVTVEETQPPDKDFCLTHGGKVLDKWEIGYTYDSLYEIGIGVDERDRVTYFYSDHTYKVFLISTGAQIGNGWWQWEEVSGVTYLNQGGWITRLDGYSLDSLILSAEGSGTPPISRWTYKNL